MTAGEVSVGGCFVWQGSPMVVTRRKGGTTFATPATVPLELGGSEFPFNNDEEVGHAVNP